MPAIINLNIEHKFFYPIFRRTAKHWITPPLSELSRPFDSVVLFNEDDKSSGPGLSCL